MAPFLLCITSMRARSLFLQFFVLFLAVLTPKAFPAFIAEAAIGMDADLDDMDDPADFTPPEHFPLTAMPVQMEDVPRSEAMTLEELRKWHDLREKILHDFGNRISGEFKIDERLRQRTAFWFDIYARFGEAHHLIHHGLYPWIVYQVADTTTMLRDGKGPPWLRHDRANKWAAKQLKNVRAALVRLAKRRSYNALSGLEKDLYDKLVPVPGPRKKVFREAARNVRSQLGQKDFFARGLVNSSRYMPYMEAEFRRLGLPVELTRLPFVESSFNEDARSKAGASGVWQIMPRTGRSYHMRIGDTIDERNSPLKATYVAGKLLHSYNRALRSWPLTITSYNHGIGNIQKAIKHARSRDLTEIIARYHRGDFKFASANYYTCFLAALYAEKYNELIFKEVPRQPLQEHEVIKLSGATSLKTLQRRIGLDRKGLLKYNLDLRSAQRGNLHLPRGFELHLPPGYKSRLLRQVGDEPKAAKNRTALNDDA